MDIYFNPTAAVCRSVIYGHYTGHPLHTYIKMNTTILYSALVVIRAEGARVSPSFRERRRSHVYPFPHLWELDRILPVLLVFLLHLTPHLTLRTAINRYNSQGRN